MSDRVLMIKPQLKLRLTSNGDGTYKSLTVSSNQWDMAGDARIDVELDKRDVKKMIDWLRKAEQVL